MVLVSQYQLYSIRPNYLAICCHHHQSGYFAIVPLVFLDHVCGTLYRSASVILTSPLDSSDGR